MSATKIELPEVFKIDATDEVYAGLISSLEASGKIEIDAQKVTAVDFAGVQLLMAFAKHCGSQKREFAVTDASEAMLAAIGAVGAGAHLGVA